jgi:hypothetical protein
MLAFGAIFMPPPKKRELQTQKLIVLSVFSSRLLFVLMIDKCHFADVDEPRLAGSHFSRRLALVVGNAQSAPEIAAGAVRQNAEFDVRARGENTVGDLVDRPVAAAGDDQFAPGQRAPFGERDAVARRFGERDLERAEMGAEIRRDRGPVFARRAARRLRVDDEERQTGIAVS